MYNSSMAIKKYDWEGVEYASPEYYRRYRLANLEHARAYHREYDSRMYKEHPEREMARRKRYKDKYPERIKANNTVKAALSSGKLIKQPCEVCKDVRAVAHHDDWSKPLEVNWLCEVHHKARHRDIRTPFKLV